MDMIDDENHMPDIYNDEDLEPELPSNLHQNYTILAEAELQRLLEDDVASLSNLLSISTADSCTLLRLYGWNSEKVHDEWFADGGGFSVRKVAGLYEETKIDPMDEDCVYCAICIRTYRSAEVEEKMSWASCGHLFCRGCWRSYIGESVEAGAGCLRLRCLRPSCNAAVGQDMVDLLACEEDRVKYSRCLLRSYVEHNPKMKWCPAPCCSFAVSLDNWESDNGDVQCRCGHVFCWDCSEEAHRPVDCETVVNWRLEQSLEKESNNWINAYCKFCPKCKSPIEKNSGCMHMTCCPPCTFEFCWLCLGEWSKHESCNGFQEVCDLVRREEAKRAIDRYSHYYERWATNHLSWQKVLIILVIKNLICFSNT